MITENFRAAFLLPAILAVVSGTSCTKIHVDDNGNQQLKSVLVTVTGGNDTKAYLEDGYSVRWDEGDGFAAFDGETASIFSLVDGAGTAKGSFSGQVSTSATSLYAAYPDSAVVESGRARMFLSPVQSAAEGSFDPSTALMVAYSKDISSIHFHNVIAFAKLCPEFDCTSATLSANDGSAIAGRLDVSIGEDGLPAQCSVTSEASSSATVSGPLMAGKTYLIGVVPGTLSKGICLQLVASDGTAYTRKKASAVEFSRGKIYNMGSFSKDGKWDQIVSAVPAESVTVSRSAVGMVEGSTLDLSAEVLPAEAASSTVTWTSSDESVATVSDGTVTALKAGSCTIKASVGTVSSACSISVIASSSSVFRLGYSQLSDIEKKAYDIMLSSAVGFEDNAAAYGDAIYNRVYLDFSSIGWYPGAAQIMRLTSLLIRDVPEAFHIANYIYRYDGDRGQYYLRTTKSYTPQKYAAYLSQIYSLRDVILAEIPSGATDYQKAKSLHDSFIRRTNYGDMTGGDAGNIVGGLVNHRVVCEGYSRSYLFLCQQAGLDAVYISGSLQTSSENDTWVNHAWNHVLIDEEWYMCDLTSDGGLVGSTIGYRNFLLGKTSATKIHSYLNTSGGDPNCDQYGYTSLPELSETDYPMSR